MANVWLMVNVGGIPRPCGFLFKRLFIYLWLQLVPVAVPRFSGSEQGLLF